MGKLEIELVPQPLWGMSLHKLLPRRKWDEIRSKVIERQSHKCGVCGMGDRLLCHEIWEYDDNNCVQKLVGFIALCNMCNFVKHIGMAGVLVQEGKVNFEDVVKHYMRVNQSTRETFEEDYKEAGNLWSERSQYAWTQEIGDYERLLQPAVIQFGMFGEDISIYE